MAQPRQDCPECGHKHEGTFINKSDVADILKCPLYSPYRTVEQENKLFGDYWVHINQEIDQMKEERYFMDGV